MPFNRMRTLNYKYNELKQQNYSVGGKRSALSFLMQRVSCQSVSCCRRFCCCHIRVAWFIFKTQQTAKIAAGAHGLLWAYAGGPAQLKITCSLIWSERIVFECKIRTDGKCLHHFLMQLHKQLQLRKEEKKIIRKGVMHKCFYVPQGDELALFKDRFNDLYVPSIEIENVKPRFQGLQQFGDVGASLMHKLLQPRWVCTGSRRRTW